MASFLRLFSLETTKRCVKSENGIDEPDLGFSRRNNPEYCTFNTREFVSRAVMRVSYVLIEIKSKKSTI